MKNKTDYITEYVNINGIDQFLLHYNNMNSELPDKEIFTIEDAGHFMMLDKPELFAYAMTKICRLKYEYEEHNTK